jgi:hypothetical protein
LAARLFEIAGISQVYVAAEFITVTRQAEGPGWKRALATNPSRDRRPPREWPAGHRVAAHPTPSQDVSAAIEVEIRDVLARQVRTGVARDVA